MKNIFYQSINIISKNNLRIFCKTTNDQIVWHVMAKKLSVPIARSLSCTRTVVRIRAKESRGWLKVAPPRRVTYASSRTLMKIYRPLQRALLSSACVSSTRTPRVLVSSVPFGDSRLAIISRRVFESTSRLIYIHKPRESARHQLNNDASDVPINWANTCNLRRESNLWLNRSCRYILIDVILICLFNCNRSRKMCRKKNDCPAIYFAEKLITDV